MLVWSGGGGFIQPPRIWPLISRYHQWVLQLNPGRRCRIQAWKEQKTGKRKWRQYSYSSICFNYFVYLSGDIPGQAHLHMIPIQYMLWPVYFNSHRAVLHPKAVLLLQSRQSSSRQQEEATFSLFSIIKTQKMGGVSSLLGGIGKTKTLEEGRDKSNEIYMYNMPFFFSSPLLFSAGHTRQLKNDNASGRTSARGVNITWGNLYPWSLDSSSPPSEWGMEADCAFRSKSAHHLGQSHICRRGGKNIYIPRNHEDPPFSKVYNLGC